MMFVVNRGLKCDVNVWLARGRHKVSLMFAMDNINGPLAYDVCVGSCDSRAFLNFLMYDLFPAMNPYPAPQSILILDNCRTHQTQDFLDLVNAYPIICLKLPFYKPYWNCAEWSFNAVKMIMSTFDDSDVSLINLVTDISVAIEMLRGCNWRKPLEHTGVLPVNFVYQ